MIQGRTIVIKRLERSKKYSPIKLIEGTQIKLHTTIKYHTFS